MTGASWHSRRRKPPDSAALTEMPNCSVLEADQKSTDRPRKRIKRAGGWSLVQQGKADWIIKNVLLQMRARTNCSSLRQFEGNPSQPYAKCRARNVPDKLEPVIDKKLGIIVRRPVPTSSPSLRQFEDKALKPTPNAGADDKGKTR